MITIGRIILGAIVAALSAAGTTWYVSDFITDKYATGFETAVNTLTANVTNLSDRLQSESETLRTERDNLADDIADRIRDSDSAQNRQVDSVSGELRALTAQLRETTNAISSLGSNIAALDKRMETSEARQVEFERYVVSVLLQTSPPPTKTFDEVQKNWGVGTGVGKVTVVGSQTRSSKLFEGRSTDSDGELRCRILPLP